MWRSALTPILALLVSLSPLSFSAASGFSATPGFIEANGYHPIKALFGFPITRLAPSGQFSESSKSGTVARSNWRISLQTDHSNIFSGGVSPTQALVLDGESTRVNLALSYRHSACTAFGVSVPFVAHHPGSFDQFIENWHDAFGLPNGRRDLSPQDRLRFDFRSGSNRLQLDSSSARIGDMQLQVAVSLSCLTNSLPRWFSSQASIRVGAKLPTGSLQQLTGSESLDGFLEITPPVFQLPRNLQLRNSLGLLLTGDVESFEQLRSHVFFGTAALTWQPEWLQSRGLSVTTQLDFHSPVFDSGLRELGANAVQLGWAAQWRIAATRELVFGFLEDAAIDTAPDFVIHVGLRQYF